ncbi:uncharacterized protein TM35_000371570 [Trypanosoma theileri]|uniref:Nucleoside-diphosphate kinase n=1 Tax=Trypanosoma theileri TaxID=67003 RepID=A0A1X0NK93_9TRYP|nr:uncharacterized protein TM35_000371570 [Trypanosoma theileri]ORC85184.1 hypothetical protein TM35_000371570 [Trypanosoma theileri]
MNTTLVLIKPHACRERFLDVARDHFDYYGIRVDDMLLLTGQQVRRGAYVERHYSSVAAVSACPSEDLTVYVSEETASLFFGAFGELWETVVEQRRVLTPEDAMTILGLTPEELSVRWWASKSRARLEHGFYVSYLQEEQMYLINGFYPALLDSFTAPESQTCILLLSWPEAKYSWKRFRLEVLGAADPREAESTSLRRLLYDNWETYGLDEQPSLMNNGLESSSGPLEALAQRFVWMHRRATEDDYGRALLREGISLEFLEKLVKNPILTYRGETRSVFELLENMQSSEVLHHAAIIFAMEKQKKINKSSIGYGESDTTSPSADWTIVLEDEDAEERRNRALVFVKPHANTPETRALVEERLMQVEGMQIVSHRHVMGKEIASRQVMDKHYGTIARYAVKVSPSSINVSVQNRAIFKEVFGISWKEALKCGRVWNAETALHVLGEISSDELYAMWGSCAKTVKLTAGAYVAHFCNEGVFVINGFYPYLRDTYSAEDARVTCYVLSWPEKCLTWRAFREELIGSTNPGNAVSNSLRGLIRDRWRDLGLQHPPTTTDNGVHASAGPFEAVLERHLWTCSPLTHDPLALRLQESGLTGALLYRWKSNPEVVLQNGRRTGCIFDLLENLQTSEMVDIMREAEEQALTMCTETPMNRGVVIIRPFALNDLVIEKVRQTLITGEIRVTRETSLFSNYVVEHYLKSSSFRAMEQLADAKMDELRDDVSPIIKSKFKELFHFAWDWCLIGGKLLGATEACEELGLTSTELLQLWEESEQKCVTKSCFIAELKSHNIYLINGFIPFVRECYGKPGNRIYLFEVEWKEKSWTWNDFCNVLIGNKSDPRTATEGSLQRIFADEWESFGLVRQPMSETTAALYVSEGPLEAAADREMWLGVDLSEDPFVQQLMLEGVPLSLLLPYVRDETLENEKRDDNDDDGKKKQYTINGFGENFTRTKLSQYQQSSEVVRRLKALTSRFIRDIKMNYAFIWVKPHACTTEVVEWIPQVLEEHRLEVISSGHVMMEEVIGKRLVDQQYYALYRNAMSRPIEEIPITTTQMVEFERTFGISWCTAVNLHMLINAGQGVERLGEVGMLDAWNNASRKVCLSPSLYVAYLEEEGLFLINGFYPYLRSRMYTGPRIYWFIVAWDGEIMTWEDFQGYVVGDSVPSAAATASLRHGLLTSWEALGLVRPPDGIDNGVHASPTPMAGLADRIAWLGTPVEEDVFGRLLLQGGVSAEYLHTLLRNPLVRHRDEPVDAVSEAFDKMCTENPLLLAQLIGLQSSGGMQLITSETQKESSPTLSPADEMLKDEKKNTNGSKELLTSVQKSNGHVTSFTSTVNKDNNTASVPASILSDKAVLPQSFRRNYAFLVVNPKCASAEKEELMTVYINDFLVRHKIRVEAGGSARAIAPALRHMAEELQSEVFKYAIKQTPSQYAIDSAAMCAFHKYFDDLWDPHTVRNAVDAAVEFNASALKLKEMWDSCTLHKRIAPSLYVGKLEGFNMYLVNGFALHSVEIFNTCTTVKRYFLLSWDNNDCDYARYLEDIIGDPYVENAKPGSLNHLLLEDWKAAGLQCPPDPFEGALFTSTSTLEAMHQRQMWLSLDMLHDTVGRFAIQQLHVSPYILRWALGNPRMVQRDGRFLFDTLRGKGSAEVLELLFEEEKRHLTTPPRNSAFVLVKSHALCRPFAMTIEMIFSRADVRIDEEGDLSGGVVRARGLVHHLYATASRYAVRDVSTIRLCKGEKDMVRRELGISWDQMVSSGVIVNAYRALEVLGGITPQHLYERWRLSKRVLTIRPDLVVAELVDSGIFVVNGYFPELKQSLESANALLHWYVVSWAEESMSWPTFLEQVVGDDNPQVALPDSIRGELFQRWREYGLTATPDLLRNGLHVSQGALQAMRERTKCLHYKLNEDYLGDVMLRHGVPERILRVWLDNPDVTSGGVEAGVFEHLRHCDTSRLLVLLTTLTEELRREEDSNKANAARIPAIGESLGTQFRVVASKVPIEQEQSQQDQQNRWKMTGEGNAAEVHEQRILPHSSDETLLYRNTAVIIIKPHASENVKIIGHLERILAENNIRVKQELRKQSCPRLVDKHLASPMYYAKHNYIQNCPEVTAEGRANFFNSFGEEWDSVLSSRRVLGAFDALSRFNMTASQLYVKWSLPQQQHVQLAYDMEVIKFHAEGVYVVNAITPLERERMISLGQEMRDVHCYVVSWDQRKCSWHQFLHKVIGDVDPAEAEKTSLRGVLYREWEEVGLPSRPNRIDNIVLASDGPLQAYVERELWCGSGDMIPDPLVRAVCYMDYDPAQLMEWKDNPLVRLTGRSTHDENVTGRMFSFTFELDTKEFVDLMSERDGFFVPIAPISEALTDEQEAGGDALKQIERRRSAGRITGRHSPLLIFDDENSRSGAGPTEWVQQALLNATEEDVARLWEHYGGTVDWEERAAGGSSGSVPTSGAAAAVGSDVVPPSGLHGSINGEAFRKDIESLDWFGLPIPQSTIRKLFEGMAWRGDGRATYEEFRLAMAVLQQL